MENRTKKKVEKRRMNQFFSTSIANDPAANDRFSLSSIFHFPFSKQISQTGQSMIEFTFATMVTLILVFALFMVFRWAGLDLAERRFAHDQTLTDNSLSPYQQLNPDFYKPRKIEAAFRGFNLKK